MADQATESSTPKPALLAICLQGSRHAAPFLEQDLASGLVMLLRGVCWTGDMDVTHGVWHAVGDERMDIITVCNSCDGKHDVGPPDTFVAQAAHWVHENGGTFNELRCTVSKLLLH